MKIPPDHVARLEEFLDRVKGQTYPEPLREPHVSITRQVTEALFQKFPLPAGAAILDVGCGQGVALTLFQQRGFSPVGITLNAIDVQVCRDRGFDVREMDQSFLEFPEAHFDLVWCRHCLEHSIFPYFTLAGFHRVLKSGGVLYVEVPAPDTSCRHQTNPNHYSVMGQSMWLELISRSGFTILDTLNINFTVPAGPDVYWAFIARRI